MKYHSTLFIIACLLASVRGKAQSAGDDRKVIVDSVHTDRVVMDYCRFGTGKKTLVILPGLSIQSIMESAGAIADAYAPLAADYTVYVFERRRELPASYTAADTAEDTAEAIRALGIEHVSVFGASYGGMVSMVLAVRYPELVDKMILASTTAELSEEQYQSIENWLRYAEEGDANALYHAFGKAVYPEAVYKQFIEAFDSAAKTVTEEELKKFITLAEGMKGFRITDELNKVQCPVLAIGDRQDQVVFDAVEKIGQYMNKSSYYELYMYDGYGHAVYDLAPDFKERMLSFLAKDQ